MPIRSLEALRGLPLRDLRLVNLPALQDLSPLREVPLQTLWVSHCPIKSFALLGNMQLEELVLERVPNGGFAFLSGLRLKSLHIRSPGFTDLRLLESMPLRVVWETSSLPARCRTTSAWITSAAVGRSSFLLSGTSASP